MSSHAYATSAVPLTPVRQRSSKAENSPRTPSSTVSTPYTAVSSRPSSTLTTPSSVKLSPIPNRYGKSTTSIADLTENWRVRAQLNGIKVSAIEDEGLKKGAHISSWFVVVVFLPISPHPSWKCLVHLLSPGFADGLPKPAPFVTPSPFFRPFVSNPNTPEKASKAKYVLGAFSSQSYRPALYDSLSDVSEDDGFNDRLKAALPVFRGSSSPRSVAKPSPRSSCSVCDKEPSGLSRMIVLSPCSHIFCSSCFTGTLNIVGEKTMSCMECHSPVDNFHFALLNVSKSVPVPDVASLGNPFEESVSTSNISKSPALKVRDQMSVLRVDNVPWDVTPLAIRKFIVHPIVRAYVLLDVKGKTLSHAFVQLAPEHARAALRSSQNAILGQGRRARAVTVTLSSKEELMAALYPHWRGSFDGFQPSLDGLDNQQVNEALHHGLMTTAELNSLFNLITTPDSHFLKVPSLPFWSLTNILSTFPVDVDSCVFWSCQLRDALFRVTHAALEILLSRRESKEDMELWNQLVEVSTSCRAFTASQVFKLQLLVDDTLVAKSKNPVQDSASKLHLGLPEKLDSLAKQFGLEPSVLAAILQSLS